MDPVPSPPRPLALTGPLQQRAGDAERQAVCDQLAAHFAAGRLREDELDARLSAAVAAGTLFDLRRLVADLPPEPAPPVLPVDRHRARRPVARARWTAVDVVALLAVVGCLGFAVLAVGALILAGAPQFVVVGFLGGSVAALGGAALCQLLHAAARRAAITAAEDLARDSQRPRIA